MAYTLQKDNAIKIVASEVKRDRLLSQGYEDITPKKPGKQKDGEPGKDGGEQ